MTVTSGIHGRVWMWKAHTNNLRFSTIDSFQGAEILPPLHLYEQMASFMIRDRSNDLSYFLLVQVRAFKKHSYEKLR